LVLLLAAAVVTYFKVPSTQEFFAKMARAKTRTPAQPQTPVLNPENHEQQQQQQQDSNQQQPDAAANPGKTEEPTAVGQLDLRFPKLANHPNVSQRFVRIERADNHSEVLNKPMMLTMKRYVTPDLPVGSYDVTIFEEPSKWRTTVPATVSDASTTPVLIASDRIVFTMKVQPPNATLVFPPGVGEVTNHVGEYFGTFWSGTFPVYAFASGYGQTPSPELVTVASSRREHTITLQKVRYPVASREPWANSLRMPFRYFDSLALFVSVAETRVSDFREFCKSANYDATNGMFSVTREGIKQVGHSWSDPGAAFNQQENFPVIGVSWNDAMEFCRWLTRKDQNEGVIRTNQSYRLPTSKEWFTLAGDSVYPWGGDPSGVETAPYLGNYSGTEMRDDKEWPSSWLTLSYNDGARRTAPAGSPFRADPRTGLYHLGGNAAEWTLDQFLCGGSWADGESEHGGLECLKTHHAVAAEPNRRDDRYGFRIVIETQK
jgi:formylglycine-generating enzyme required for sulfatase activity